MTEENNEKLKIVDLQARGTCK